MGLEDEKTKCIELLSKSHLNEEELTRLQLLSKAPIKLEVSCNDNPYLKARNPSTYIPINQNNY